MKFFKCFIAYIFIQLFHNSEIYGEERIHFITTPIMGTDAIILESNGKFAMIDTGEDFDFPDGSNENYPLRDGVITDSKNAITDRVFAHLEKIGAKELDFIILTHAHSDHIGNASEIINRIPTKKVYLKKYTDERIINKNRLWDSQYVYDKTISAIERNNVELIQDITKEIASFKFNNMSIELLNYQNEYKDGKLVEVWDDNVNSILSIIAVGNRRIFLGGDLDNTSGLEDKYANIIGKVDIMKFNHHVDTKLSNSKNFVEKLYPEKIIKTSPTDIESSYKKWLDSRNIDVVDTGRSDVSAVVLEIKPDEIKDVSDYYGKYGVYKDNNKLKFKLWNGELASEGWLKNNGMWYYVQKYGELKVGWLSENNKSYYLDNNGVLVTNQEYKIDGNIYYFKENGELLVSSFFDFSYYDSTGKKFDILRIIMYFVSLGILIVFIFTQRKTLKKYFRD